MHPYSTYDLKMPRGKITNHRFKEFNKSTPSVILAAPCIPLKYQTVALAPRKVSPLSANVGVLGHSVQQVALVQT